MASDKIVMGLDIGSGMVRAVVGSLSRDGQLMIDTLCEKPSEGVENGVVVNVEQTFKSIYSVIQEAELQSGLESQVLVTGIGGSTISCKQSSGVTGINAKGLEITSSDIYRSLEIARTIELPPDKTILHTLVQDFSVDGRGGIKDPVDMTGHRLESRALVVTGSTANVVNLKKCISRAGVQNSRLFLSSLADAEVVLSQDEKDMGTILINIGSDVTDMIAYQNGSPCYVGGIDLGGDSVTNDIAYILNKPKQIAEQVKCEYGCSFLPAVKDSEKILIPQVGGLPSIQMPRKELCKIIEPRMAEIFSMLQNDLLSKSSYNSFGGGIVLVGGGSLLSGVTELATEIFGMQCRLGFPEAIPGLDRVYINPKYTTVLGLLKAEARKHGQSEGSSSKGRKNSNKSGVFTKIGNFFKTVV